MFLKQTTARLVISIATLGLLGVFSNIWCDNIPIGQNLAPNPGAEEGGGVSAEHWTPIAKQGKCERDGNIKYSGQYSFRIDGVTASSVKGEVGGWYSDKIPLAPWRVTTFSAWTKTKGNGRWGSLTKLDIYDTNGKRLTKFDPYIADEHDWTELVKHGITPDGTAYGIFNCYTYDDTNVTAWFDDLSLTQSAALPVLPTNGAVLYDPFPILSWPQTKANKVELSRDDRFSKNNTKAYEITGRRGQVQQIPEALVAGKYYWRLINENHENAARTVASATNWFTVEKRPYKRWAFDFGAKDTPVELDYIQVTPETLYSAEKGFGWDSTNGFFTDNQPDKNYRLADTELDEKTRSQDNHSQSFLTAATRDLVGARTNHTFTMDIPNGQYDLYIVSGHPAFDSLPPYVDFDITANAQRLGSMAIYYPRIYFQHRHYTVEVKDKKLALTFSSDKLSHGWFINALLIIERDARSKARWDVARLLDSIYYLPHDIWPTYFEVLPTDLTKTSASAGQPTKGEKQNGMICFARKPLENIYPETKPKREDVITALDGETARGQFVDLTFAIYPLREIQDLRAGLTDLSGPAGSRISASNCTIGKVMINYSCAGNLGPAGRAYTKFPDGIYPFDRMDLFAEQTQQYWITIKIPMDAQAGNYEGHINLSAPTGEKLDVPVKVKVFPFALAQHGLLLEPGFYDATFNWMSSAQKTEAGNAVDEVSLWSMNNLADHIGGIIITAAPEIKKKADGSFTLNWSKQDALISRLKSSRCRINGIMLSVSAVGRQLAELRKDADAKYMKKHITGPVNLPPEYWEQFGQLIQEMVQYSKDKGINRRMYYVWDEVSKLDIPWWLQAVKLIKSIDANGLIYALATKKVFDGIGMPGIGEHVDVWLPYAYLNAEERQKLIARGLFFASKFGYPPQERGRAESGFGMWRGNCISALRWAYDGWSMNASAATALDAQFWGEACNIWPGHPPVNRIFWETTRQGFDDLRTVLTLQELIRRAQASGKQELTAIATDAAKAIAELRQKTDPNKIYAGFFADAKDYDMWRSRFYMLINRFVEAGLEPDPKWILVPGTK